MSEALIARRYAKALFSVERKAGKDALTKTFDDLSFLTNALRASPKLGVLYRNPLFTPDEKYSVTSALLQLADTGKNVQNFCRLLAEQGRLELVPQIAQAFQEFLDAETGLMRGELVTAVALDDGKRKSVLEQLEKQTNRSLSLEYSVDSAIIGGVVLKVGDYVLDASLRAQLSTLKENIKRGEPGHAD